MTGPTHRLLIWCPDRRGIIAAVTRLLAEAGANILDADQHSDPDDGSFTMRLAFQGVEPADVRPRLDALAAGYQMRTLLRDGTRRRRMAVLVSRQDHCLADLLYRQRSGELDADLACVVSNHPDAQVFAERAGTPFHHLPVTKATKDEQERRLLMVLEDAGTDVVVLARYMQVLSPTVIDPWEHRIINIHHSFLPAFAGGRPYHQAAERGVKLIGATAHYVTEELDAGPIIAQQTAAVSHRDGVADLVRKGRDLERTTLAAAVRAHLEDRVLARDGRTVVFD